MVRLTILFFLLLPSFFLIFFLLFRYGFLRVGPRIKTVSLVPGIDLRVGAKEKMELFLNEVGFWDKDALSDIRFPRKKATARVLLVRLVDAPENYWWRQVTEEGQIVAAVDSRIERFGKAVIDIYVWEDIIKGGRSLRDDRISSLLIRGVYGIVPQLREGAGFSNREKAEHMSRFVRDYSEKYGRLLETVEY